MSPRFSGLVLDVGDAGAELARVDGGRRMVLAVLGDGALPLSVLGAGVVIRLPADQALLRQLDFPRAAERDLKGIVAFEAERQTPFLPGEAVIDHRIVDRGAERLCVELAILPHARLAAAKALAAQAGLAIAGVGLAADPAGPPLFDFLLKGRVLEAPLRRWLRRAAWASPALLTVVGGLTLWFHTTLTLEAMKDEAMARRADIAEVQRMRREIAALDAALAILPRRRMEPTPLAVLDELTRLMPDGVWLVELRIDRREGIAVGHALTAAPLVERIDTSPLLANARFKAPVTRQGETERFSLAFDRRAAP